LIGVSLGNGSVDHDYPNGDEVQVAVPWSPPQAFDGLSDAEINAILDIMTAGMPDGSRYSAHPNASTRAAWKLVVERGERTQAQAKTIVKTWLASGLLREEPYHDKVDRKDRTGLVVDDGKRPGRSS
jgi:hypothetical protein